MCYFEATGRRKKRRVLDNCSSEASRMSLNDKDFEKKLKKEGALATDTSPMEILDSSPSASSKKEGRAAKRKRASIDGNMSGSDKESMVDECHRELNVLFGYYKEISAQKLKLEVGDGSSINSVIACLLEECDLPFSKLVEEVYEKLKAKDGVTLASVRSIVLSVGKRMGYGITKEDDDVLEDESQSCLWCWETRDMKLLPFTQRGFLNVRRTARKKIHERISAISGTLSALSAPESDDNYKSNLAKASVKLRKARNAAEIRSLVEKLIQKNNADMPEKEAKLKEKELSKEMERNIRSAEKEKKRMEREIEKEKLHNEKEQKRLQEEAEKKERRREKEEAELKKQLKKQQEEAERDQRRQEKLEAEQKKQLAIQKQATIMERFLKSKKSNAKSDNDKKSPMKDPISDSSREEVASATTSSMDCVLSQQNSLAIEDLRKFHLAGWHKVSGCNRSCHWGVRRKPKVELFKELKLQALPSEAESPEKVGTPDKGLVSYKGNTLRETSLGMSLDGLGEISETNQDNTSSSVRLLCKKLLQFAKSHRPAYYGTWSKKSSFVGPRNPFKKDPDLDYDVDSDEEWEEEEPGESLSDCDKDNEEEHLQEENLEAEDEDDFVVPDGYLSENEGVQVDSSSDGIEEEARSSPCCKPEVESEEIRLLLQQYKYLHSSTEQALRKGIPLVISNLMHEKSQMVIAEDLHGTHKSEQICLQALSMQACPGGSIVDILANEAPSSENQEVIQSQNRNDSTPTTSAATIPDSYLPEIVCTIQSNPQGMNKVVELLQLKFPSTSKSQLRNKVKEISDFVDNRWKVKREVLERLGLSTSPGKSLTDKSRRPKGIATYFSKRCLPPEEKSMNIADSSSQSCSKTKALHDDGGCPSHIDLESDTAL